MKTRFFAANILIKTGYFYVRIACKKLKKNILILIATEALGKNIKKDNNRYFNYEKTSPDLGHNPKIRNLLTNP